MEHLIGIFSGGGSHGAEKVGVLYKDKPKFYKTYGCSTGALIAPLAALGEYEILKNSYLSVTDKDIFNVLPYDKNGKIRIINLIFRLLNGEKSIGESHNLLNLIRQFYTPEMHLIIKDKCTVVRYDVPNQRLEYINSGDVSYENFTKAMWHSCNVPLAMTFDQGKIDGGIVEVVPISKSLLDNPPSNSKIKVYLCRKENWNQHSNKIGTLVNFLSSLHNAMRKSIEYSDLKEGMLLAEAKGIPVEIDYQHPDLEGDALRFIPELMKQWFMLGLNK